MSDDIGLQQAILASLKSAPRTSGGGGSGSGGGSWSSRPQPTITRSNYPSSSSNRNNNNTNNNNNSIRRPPLSSNNSSSFLYTSPSSAFPSSDNVVSLPNARRNTLQRQGIKPTAPNPNSATALAMQERQERISAIASSSNQNQNNSNNNNNIVRTPRQRSTPAGKSSSINSAPFPKRGGGGGREEIPEFDDDNNNNNNSNINICNQLAPPPLRPSTMSQNISRNANTSSPIPATTSTSINSHIENNSSSLFSSSNTWSELLPCLQASGKVQKQNPGGSHLVFDSANSDSSNSLERILNGISSTTTSTNNTNMNSNNNTMIKLFPSDFMGIVTSNSITNVTRGSVPATANGAIFQCALKPMSKICVVLIGVISSSPPKNNSNNNNNNSMTLLELSFASNTGTCSASEYSFVGGGSSDNNNNNNNNFSSSDFSFLSKGKQVERPTPLRAVEASTGARYARPKNHQTDWQLMPISVTMSNGGSLQLDVNGETVMKNVAVPSLASVPHSRIFLAVSGRCAVKNLHIGDVSEIRKQQLAQNVTAAANPLVAMIESEILDRNPNVQWSDVAALEDAKRILNESIVLPMIIPEFFTGMRSAFKGVLLYGPPGTGKTLLARAVATSTKTTFFNISSASITDKFLGQSEKLVRTLFQVARRDAPSTIFFDEIDSVMTRRGGAHEHEASRRMKTEMLQQMDGVMSGPNSGDPTQNVIVLATTNAPWSLDDAVIRRLEKRIYVPLPNASARLDLLKTSLKKLKTDFDFESFEKKADLMQGMAEVATILDKNEEERRQKMFARQRNQQSNNSNNNNNSNELIRVDRSQSIFGNNQKSAGDDHDEENEQGQNKTSSICQDLLKNDKNAIKLMQLVEATDGYSGADLNIVLRDASMFPLRRLIGGKSPQEIYEMKQRGELLGRDGQPPPVMLDDIAEALKKVNPSVNQADLFKFAEWEREFGSS